MCFIIPNTGEREGAAFNEFKATNKAWASVGDWVCFEENKNLVIPSNWSYEYKRKIKKILGSQEEMIYDILIKHTVENDIFNKSRER